MNTALLRELASADRLRLAETFVRIVDAGSLSAAATQLGTTQPTVSRRLQALERHLGVPLLQRSTHAMKLTADGQRCYDHARRLLEDWQAFESDMRGDQEEPSGVLRVLAPHAFGQHQFIRPLVAYLQRYPRMRVEWLLHDRVPDFIAEGMDCAIQVGDITDPSVIALRLGKVPRIAVAAPGLLEGRPAPRHPRELETLPWLALRTFYQDEVVLQHRRTGERWSFAIEPRLSTDGLYALRNAMLQGLGAGIVSSWVLEDDVRTGQLLHLAPEWEAASLPLSLVYPPAKVYPARLRRFIDIMRTELPGIMRQATT